MSATRSDALLWMSLGLFGIFAVYAARSQLHAVRRVSLITQEEKEPELISQHTEDALKLTTIRELVFGSNQDIHRAAIKIVLERAVQDKTFQLLLRHIAGTDAEQRDQALTSLRYLSVTWAKSNIEKASTCRALIDCLCRFLPPEGQCVDLESAPQTRHAAERDALILLDGIAQTNLDEVMRAGFVTHYLAKIPFGNPSEPKSRMDILYRIKTGETNDFALSHILNYIDEEPLATEVLVTNGLLILDPSDLVPDEWECVEARAHPNRSLADSELHAETPAPGTRTAIPRGPREQAARRRRREAMVVSEGPGPIHTEDIIQRDIPQVLS